MAESLFSLELLVQWVRLDPAMGMEEEPAHPAVAFRLLDFPTLLIRPHWQHGHPDSAHLHFPFGRGKSCLFRGVPEALLGQLCSTPLYAMLLNVPSGPALPRLLGSCPLSLAGAAGGLLEEMKGCSLPCVRAHQGVHPLQDLLGRPVGEISLGYRLLSLGGGLERHFNAPAKGNVESLQVKDNEGSLPFTDNKGALPPIDNLGSHSAKAAENRDTAPKEKVMMVEQAVQTSAVAASTQPLEGPELEPQHPSETLVTPNAEHTSAGHPCSQKEGDMVCFPRVPEKSDLAMLDRQELEIEANLFCPPPMYYSRPSSSHIENTMAPTGILDMPVPSAFPVSHSSEEDEKCGPREVLNPPKSDSKLNGSPPVAPPASAATLGQLPLLNALLLELSLLNQGSIRPPNHNPTVHPQLACLYQPTNEECKALITVQDKGGQTSPSPSMPKRNKSTLSPVSVTPSPMLKTRLLKGPAKVQDKKGSEPTVAQPKKKLMYGLTNTLRLRLQQTNPDMLLLHERRERLRKQQAEAIKGKRDRPRSRGILARSSSGPAQRHKPHTLRSKRGARSSSVNENIETLIESSMVYEQDSRIKDEHKPLHQHVLKHVNENVVKSGHTKTNQMSVETVHSTALPRLLFVDSDTNLDLQHRVTAHGTYMDLRSIKAGNSQLSARTSGNTSPVHHNAEDLITNLEYTGYSDDFTSPHYTSRSSGALDGSPQPDKSELADGDSESSSLPRPAFISKSESISAPIPLISNASPVHSYKRAHDLVKHRSLVNAVNVANSDPDVVPQKLMHSQHTGISVSNATDGSSEDGFEIRNIGNMHDTSQSIRTSQMSSYMPSTTSDPRLSILGSDTSDPSLVEGSLSDLGSLDFYKQIKPISELVVNKLPGYTM